MKKILSTIIAFVLTISLISMQSIDVSAASKKYVKSVSVTGYVTVNEGVKKTLKVKVKVKGKASSKVKVKSSDSGVAKASYSAKKKTITITGVRAGQTKITVTSVGKNKKKKRLLRRLMLL